MSTYGWRVWRLGVDEQGPVLVSPYLPDPPTAPGPLVQATCDRGHAAPDPDCVCGLYAMTSRAEVAMWCCPADVVTRVRLRGRVLPGGREVLGALPNEVRAASVLVMSPSYLHPALAEHADALALRYGITFTPDPALAVSGPDALEQQAQALLASARNSLGWG